MTAAPLIEAAGICVAPQGQPILRDVHLRIAAGEIVTLVGPNGSGKTTLLGVLVGAIAPDRGRVSRAPGLRIGYVPQRLAIDRTMPMTTEGFVALGTAPRGIALPGAGRERRAAARAALVRVGMAALGGQQLATLSGGQFQRALLARALIRRPGLLVLDEPTQGLDQPGVAAFYRLIDDVRADLGCGVLMVSHDLHVVMSASDRVICLNGHICCEGTPTVVTATPEYRALFGLGTEGALALYRHVHDHRHDPEVPAGGTHADHLPHLDGQGSRAEGGNGPGRDDEPGSGHHHPVASDAPRERAE